MLLAIRYELLKALDTLGKCQRPFDVSVSQHMHKQKQLCENLDSIGHQSCKRILKEKKNTLVALPWCAFRCMEKASPKVFYYLSNK